MKKIGILGGTFDPIHIGHLVAADQALFHSGLDEIWFMPAPNPPHKSNANITSINHRVEMVKSILKIDSRYRLCTIELERTGKSYTIDTIKEIKARYPEDSFYFIIGGDMIEYLPKWYGIEQLINLVQFIGLQRPGYDYEHLLKNNPAIYQKLTILPMPQLDVSSTIIRNKVKSGEEIRYFVPEFVEQYIREHNLYES